MAGDAFPPRPLPLGHEPIAIGPAMYSVLPVTIDGAMALGAHQLRLVPGDLTSLIINERVAIGPVMTVETTCIGAVFQLDFRMLR